MNEKAEASGSASVLPLLVPSKLKAKVSAAASSLSPPSSPPPPKLKENAPPLGWLASASGSSTFKAFDEEGANRSRCLLRAFNRAAALSRACCSSSSARARASGRHLRRQATRRSCNAVPAATRRAWSPAMSGSLVPPLLWSRLSRASFRSTPLT